MFIRIGDRAINLNNVAQIYARSYDTRPCIQIDFVGEGLYERFYSDSAEYAALDTWINARVHIKQYADVYTRIAVALELLERR